MVAVGFEGAQVAAGAIGMVGGGGRRATESRVEG